MEVVCTCVISSVGEPAAVAVGIGLITGASEVVFKVGFKREGETEDMCKREEEGVVDGGVVCSCV